jgi:iron complex outermembrane receptor protein
MKKLKLLLTLTLALHFTAFSQNKVNGTIIDKLNKKTKALANVRIVELNRYTISADNGSFAFDDLPLGKFTIQLQLLGYATLVARLDINKGDNANNYELTPAAIETPEVTISAPYISGSSTTAYKIESVSKADMLQDGSITLTESLTKIPGVNQLTTGVGVTKPIVRGLYGNRVLTAIDGFRFDNQQWQDEHGLGLSDMGISRVELIKGPASVIYGSDAMGGVINLVEEDNAPIGKTVGDFNSRFYSNTLGIISDIGLKNSTEKYHWKIRTGGESNANYLDGSNKIVPNTRYNGAGLKANFGFDRKWVSSDFNYNFSFYQFGIIEANEASKPIVNAEEERFGREMEEAHHTVGYHLISTKNTFYLGKSKIKFDAGAHLNNRQEEEGKADIDKKQLNMQLNTYSYNLRWVSPSIAKSELIIGNQSTIQINSNSGARVIIPDANTYEFSGYAFLKHSLNQLTIEEGFRANIYSIKTNVRGNVDSAMAVKNAYMPSISSSYKTNTASLGAVYNIGKSVYVKVNGSSGYRAPNLAELSSNGLHEGSTRYEKGNAALKAENNFEIDGSINYHNSWLMMDLAVYQNQINNFIYIASSTSTFLGYKLYNYLQTNANLTGVEAVLDIKIPFYKALDYRASYATITAKAADGSYIPLMPADKFSNELKWNLTNYKAISNSFVKAGLVYVWAQNKLAAGELATPDYFLVNISLGGTIKIKKNTLNTTLFCNNLLGVNYFDHLSRIKKGSFADPTIGFYNPGRNIGLSINIPFIL